MSSLGVWSTPVMVVAYGHDGQGVAPQRDVVPQGHCLQGRRFQFWLTWDRQTGLESSLALRI